MSILVENPDENLEVIRSSRVHRTNLPATETPPFLAKQMVQMAGIKPGHYVLEPSAGAGNLAIAARAAGGNLTCIELKENLVHGLRNIGFPTIHGDFLVMEPMPQFHAVVMCPPFNAIPHVMHARRFLRDGGKLVALIRRDAAGIEDVFVHYHPLPDDLFAMDGNNVPSGLVILKA